MIDIKTLAECYQPLFDLLSQEYNLAATISEMDEIIDAVKTVQENRIKYYDEIEAKRFIMTCWKWKR